MPRIQILSCSYFQGNLYTVMGEDEALHVAETFFVVHGVDGVTYILDTYRVPGFYRDEDGCAHPNRNYRAEADAFVARVEVRGSIASDLWLPYVTETWTERNAYDLRCEQDEREWEGGGCGWGA